MRKVAVRSQEDEKNFLIRISKFPQNMQLQCFLEKLRERCNINTRDAKVFQGIILGKGEENDTIYLHIKDKAVCETIKGLCNLTNSSQNILNIDDHLFIVQFYPEVKYKMEVSRIGNDTMVTTLKVKNSPGTTLLDMLYLIEEAFELSDRLFLNSFVWHRDYTFITCENDRPFVVSLVSSFERELYHVKVVETYVKVIDMNPRSEVVNTVTKRNLHSSSSSTENSKIIKLSTFDADAATVKKMISRKWTLALVANESSEEE